MVMVGHSARLATPLSRRQTRLMTAVLGSVLALVVGAIVFASLNSSQARSGHGCVNLIVSSTMGAGQWHRCGTAARQWCASLVGKTSVEARLVLPECRRAGYGDVAASAQAP
jgi:hypothetical protein